MTRREQIKLLQAQCRELNAQEIEIRARRHKLEETLNKLQDEEQLALLGDKLNVGVMTDILSQCGLNVVVISD